MSVLFGYLALCECLVKLGFKPQKQTGTSHVKFLIPQAHKISQGMRPFIIVIYNKRQYDKHTCSRYITEIARLGFDRKKVVKLLRE